MRVDQLYSYPGWHVEMFEEVWGGGFACKISFHALVF